MVLNPGPHTLILCFICAVSGGSMTSSGKTGSPTTRSDPPSISHCCINAAYAGLVTWAYRTRSTMWRTCNRYKAQRSPTAALQGCMQERYESLPHPTRFWEATRQHGCPTVRKEREEKPVAPTNYRSGSTSFHIPGLQT